MEYNRCSDAMLESVPDVPQFQTPVIQQTQLWNIPTWTLKKVCRNLSIFIIEYIELGFNLYYLFQVEHIFSNITGKIKKKLNIKERTLVNRRTSLNSTIR